MCDHWRCEMSDGPEAPDAEALAWWAEQAAADVWADADVAWDEWVEWVAA